MLPLAAAAFVCAALLFAPSGTLLNADPPERDDVIVPSDLRVANYEYLLHSSSLDLVDPSVAVGRNEWDVLHYEIVLVPDFEDGSLHGYVDVTFDALRNGMTSIELDLYDNLPVLAVRNGVQSLGFSQENDVLYVRLPEPLVAGDTWKISIEYSGSPQPAGPLGLAFDTTPAGNPILATVSEPFYARSWWPCKDTVLDKATVDIMAVVPQGMFAASAGTLVSSFTSGSNTLYRWSSSYPMSTYNVSLAVAEYASWSEDYVSPEGNEFPLDFHVFPEHEEIARYEFERVGQMIDFFSGLYGPYAFDQEKYGMAEVVLAGAMEHQTMTSYGDFFMTGDRYYEGIVAHELSHHWWGNLLTLTDWDDAWLHEGLATFSDALWREHIEGRDAYQRFLRQRAANCCGFFGPISPPIKAFNQTVYHKGAWMLHMLREMIGNEDFFAALRSLTSDPELRFAHFTRHDFIDAFEAQTGLELNWFFDQWLHRVGRPAIKVEWSREKVGQVDQFVLLKVKQTQEDDVWQVPLRLRIEVPSGTIDRDLFLQERVTELRIDLAEWPTDIVIDPDEQLLLFNEGVVEVDPALIDPDDGRVLTSAPNPFNPRTALRFALTEGASVRLRIYDLRGRAVRTLDLGWREPGDHQAIWEGTDDAGRSVASGSYFVKLEGAGRDVPAHRVTLVR